ncbi:unnamed protein product [Spodoptera exigua]|nr:unnamed protein product [Spodoptera exigua]
MTKNGSNTTTYGTEDKLSGNEANETLDLDDLLPKIGEFGLYQKLLLWLVCLPACLPCGFCAFNQLFMTDVPDYWCRVPELELLNLTQEQRKLLSIPRKFDLVCEYDVYPTLGLVALNIGGPIGVYAFGLLNDRIGRKKSFFLCLSTLLLGSLMTAYAHEFWFWIMARVIVGLTIPAVYQIPFIIYARTETLILYLISKCFISASFLLIYPYAGELYPTELRGVGIGTSAYIGGLGLIIIPFINYLGSSNLVLPLVVMGAVSVVGGLSALRLPETLHTSLPQTAEEGEEFGKDWTYADCLACGDQRKITDADSYENLDQLELTQAPLVEDVVPEIPEIRRSSMRKLVRQASIVETQRDIDGNIKMTYWF